MQYPHPVPLPLYRPTTDEWFSEPFVQTLATSEPLGWNTVVRSTHLSATTHFNAAPRTTNDTLVLTLEGSARVEGRIAGYYFNKQIATGDLMIHPRGCDMVAGRWDASVKAVFVELSHQGLIDIAASTLLGDPERVEILLKIGLKDTFLRHLCVELHHELQNGGLFGVLFAESVSNTIVLHLLRNYSNVSTLHPINGGKLTSLQLRLVDDYIQTHLHEKISLADLANCLHLSVPHFEKMFRATRHCPPYRYVLECKIERAKLLLSGTQLSLYEVALDCGFADQSHFTRHFTRFVGVSPARFVRSTRRA